ncbi:MAG: hypothetical protein MUF57_01195 [Gammaproteobacteria bacterium]|nr:hypothetical protein [Gammaproteobacteria bacterium]
MAGDAPLTYESDEQAVRVLVKALDEYYGTPCEKIRHQQEVEKLERDRARLIDALRAVVEVPPGSAGMAVMLDRARAVLKAVETI